MDRKALGWLLLAASPYVVLALGSQKAERVDFESQIRPILKAHCLSCHSSTLKMGGLDLSGPSGIAKAIVAGNPEASVLIQRVKGLGGKPRMPLEFAPLSAAQIGLLEAWVKQGAKFAPPPTFEKDVAPILKAHCISCHGANNPPAGLSLTSGANLLKAKVVVPGDSENSRIVRRLRGLDGKPSMPMGFAPLSAAQIQTVRDWIDAGASIEGGSAVHWAYVAPKKAAPPKVKNAKWVANPVDAFILAKLESQGLKPSPPASKETLLRRVTLDLIGLPPTLEEMNAFLADKSPNAYEKVVDRLLASPHYGERQARVWLDLARYADTHGYEADRSRQAYLFRDWVIDAFNKNKPFDRFTIEQIAGDLLPSPTIDQLVATGFHRNSMFNEEGGVDPNESMYETVMDRVNTTSTVWLGSTLACSRCHDHKFDPFTQKDYFQMYAFFANNAYESRGDNNVGQQKFYEPNIEVASPEIKAKLASLRQRLDQLNAQLSTPPEGQAAWEAEAAQVRWNTLSLNAATRIKQKIVRQDDGSYFLPPPTPDRDRFSLVLDLPPGSTGVRIEAVPDPAFPNQGPGQSSGGNFILTALSAEVAGKPLALSDVEVDFIQGGYDLGGLFDGNPETGWAIYPQPGKPHELVVGFAKPVSGQITLNLEFGSQVWPAHLFGRFRVSATTAAEPWRFALGSLRQVLGKSRTDDESRQLAAFYAKVAPRQRELRKQIADVQAQMAKLGPLPTAMVMRDRPANGPLKAYVHTRGEFLGKGEEVEANTPHFLPPLPKSRPANRLALAKWLVSKSNPLTARVQVNRMWAQYFGHGLVETEEDFGTQGSPPTHPQLLDWLATEFMDRGWDMKAIHRVIVTSNTYRQSSAASAALTQKDPQNHLYARGPRFRMEAEMVRDTALAASGLLNPKVGGPSVMPYQPDGIWDSPYSGERWMNVQGPEAHRRGLYVFLKRTAAYPSFLALDAGSRETCLVRRIRTNTPLQALALLNDPVYLEAAKGLAARLEKKPTDESKIAMGFRLCVGRSPSAQEQARLKKLLSTLRNRYAKDQTAAKKLAGNPEQAAWTMVANVLLNLDETITKS